MHLLNTVKNKDDIYNNIEDYNKKRKKSLDCVS